MGFLKVDKRTYVQLLYRCLKAFTEGLVAMDLKLAITVNHIL